MSSFFSDQLIYALSWTLLHSLWLIGLAALILYFFITQSKHETASFRYTTAISTLAISVILVACAFGYTYFQYQPAPEKSVVQAYTIPPHHFTPPSAASYTMATGKEHKTSYITFSDINQMVERSAPTLVIAWICGVVLLSLRFLGGFAYTRRLKHHPGNIPHDYWQTKAQKLAISIGLDKKIRVIISSVAKVPMVIGHLKPVILLPASLIVSLPSDQLEAVLVHELAHIYRKDYWINILQSLAEIIFFYHPALWWISSVIRTERENCCDDQAVSICGNTITYAKALAHIEESWQQSVGFAMAATGKKGSLLQRIERLLHPHSQHTHFGNKYVSALAMVLIMLTAGTGMAYRAYETPLHHTVVKILNIPQVNSPDQRGVKVAAKSAENIQRLRTKHYTEKQHQVDSKEDPCWNHINGQPCEKDQETRADTLLPLNIEEDVGLMIDINLDSLWDPNIDLDVNIDPAIAVAMDTVSGQYFFNFSEEDSAFQFKFDAPDAPNIVFDWSMPPMPFVHDTLFPPLPPHSFFSDTLIRIYGHPEEDQLLRLEQAIRALELDSALQHFQIHLRDSIIQGHLADAMLKAEENVQLLRERLADSLGSFDFSIMQSAWERNEEALRAQSEALAKQAEILRKRAEEYEKKATELKLKAKEKAKENRANLKENSFEQSTRKLEKELLEDGLIKKGEQYRFELKQNQLEINGKKQSQKTYEKYTVLLKNLMNVNVENEGNFSLTKTPYE